jgi:gamma-tubulin complex component 2
LLAQRILAVCADFIEISKFIDARMQFEYGLVNHALCDGLNSLLKDYLVLAAQLETLHNQGKLTLQVRYKLRNFVIEHGNNTFLNRNFGFTFNLRCEFSNFWKKLRAMPSPQMHAEEIWLIWFTTSQLLPLGTIHEDLNTRLKTNDASSDKKTEELFTYLLTKASQPYFDMLTLWVYNGVVRDPYCEFCVKQNQIKTNESHFNDA